MKNNYSNLTNIKVSNSSLNFIKRLLITLMFFAFSIQSFSQTDDCATPTSIAVGTSCTTTSYNVTSSNSNTGAALSCAGTVYRDGWYTFTTDATTTNISIVAEGNREIGLAIYTGTGACTALTQTACIVSNNGNATLSTTVLPNTTYKLRLMRTSTGGGNMTGLICVTKVCHPISYCSTTYPSGVEAITNVTFAGINNTTSNGTSGGNQEIFCNEGNVLTGNTYSISLNGDTAGAFYNYFRVYYDWNKNGVFTDAGESYDIGAIYNNNGTGTPATSTILVPVGATAGKTTMRIIKRYNGYGTSCNNAGFGQTEDYIINVTVPVPTITSFSPSTGCVGSNITITGNNLSAASSVTIGGTAATITANTSTSISVTVGTGTTGIVSVTTLGGIANSVSSFTVLATPNITVQPVSPTAVCAGSGIRTITVTATGATTYQWRRNGINLTNTAPYSNVTTNTLTITNPTLADAGNFDVVIGNGTSCNSTSNAVALTVVTTPSITTNPANSAIVTGANTSFTVAASYSPTSYLWQVSTNGGGTWSTVTNGGVYTNATTATLNITNATSLMNGNLYRASATNSCGTSSFSTSALLTISYCIPTVSNSYEQYNYINQVSFLGNLTNPPVNNSTWSTSPRGYQDFTALTKATQAQGEGVNVFMNTTTTYGTNYMKAWVDWNKNGAFETSEIVYQCTNAFVNTTFGFQIPLATISGDYRIRIRILASYAANNTFDSCTFYNNVDGETEDYLFTVVDNCGAKITSITNNFRCGNGAVTLNAVGSAGTTEYRWYTTSTGGTFTSSPTSSWNTPSISTTTTYYVTAYNGSCESLYRTAVIATIKKVPSLTFSNANPEICGENEIIDLTATGTNEQIFLVDEGFESGTSSFANNQIASPNGSITNWQIRSSTYVPAYPTYPVWYPAISSGFGSNKFMMSTSDLTAGGTTAGKVNEALELTTAVNTTDFINLTLTFKIYFSSYYDANNASVEGIFIETNTGSGWSATPLASYLTDQGIGTNFVTKTIPMNSFININSLKVRIRYLAGWCDGVAIDDIKLFGEKPLVPNFTWTSGFPIDAYTDFACTIPYTSGTPASVVYVKPTLVQLENATFSFTANANLANGCTTSGTINVTNKTRIWKGTVNTNWNNSNNWSPNGIPTIDNCVIIPNNTIISGTNYNAFGKNLKVKNAGILNIQSSNNITIADEIIVESTGLFQIENNSNLVQINNNVNTGNIIYKRIAPSIKGSDYVYWSSPVNNQAISSIYTSPAQGPKYEWNTLINNGNGTGGNTSQGNWVSPTATMATGKGYIIRGSSSFGMAATNINSTFTGIPNNGIIPVTVSRGTYIGTGYTGVNGVAITKFDDNHNLIGNPYPSAINALQFLNDNSAILEGNIRLWTHGTNPGTGITNPFYGSYSYNYSASDYMTINFTGSTIPTASSSIKAGQAFFVIMQDGATSSGTVNFNNAQRRDSGGLPYANDNFFRSSNQQDSNVVNFDDLERHRIWLDIKNANNITETTLVGYVEGATMNSDSTYDALTNPLDMGIYSIVNNESFIIQGRSLPFDDNDQVAIGFNVPTTGTYSIGINTADGLFLGTQNIYLKDELLNVYHNLKTTPYSFTATAGIHDTRFKLVYKNTVLSNVTFNENEFQIAKNKNIIEIVSGNEIMENVKVFDIRGRLIVEKSSINSNSISIDMMNVQDQVLIVNIVTTEGIKVTKKIL